MKQRVSILSFILLGMLLVAPAGCTHTSSCTPLEAALREAGSNRAELEKVLAAYACRPQDSLKYRAACFLIENMPGRTYYEGEQPDHYLEYYKALHLCPNRTPAQLWDSIQGLYGTPSPRTWQQRYDLQVIDSAYLCDNIEYAFKVWHEFPWCSHLSFDAFCEQILPYRIRNERLENWRPALYAQYAPVARQLLADGCTDPVQAAVALTDKLRSEGVRFTMTAPPYMPVLPPSYGKYLSGSCADVTGYVICVARSIGIPCAMDFTPLRRCANSGHVWTAYHNREGQLYLQDFLGEIVPAGHSRLQENIRPLKVYRNTDAIDWEADEQLRSVGGKPCPYFVKPRFTDATTEYRDYYVDSITIPLNALYNKPRKGAAYLCLAAKQDWRPVAWAPVGKDGICFRHLNQGNVARLMAWRDGEFVPLCDPFYIGERGVLAFYSPSERRQTVTLFSKTDLEPEVHFFNRMVRCVFEGSDTPDFAQRDTLYWITEAPSRLYTKVSITPNKAYRYVRYYAADSTICSVAELSFYENGKKIPIPPDRIMGTPGCWQGDGSHEYPNAFDGLTTTSFEYKSFRGGWAGVDFGTPRRLSHVEYTPLNRDNFIRPGDEYELFFLDKIWVSLGRTVATADSLCYTNVPENTLLYLKNHTRGQDERIFTYENGKQEWK